MSIFKKKFNKNYTKIREARIVEDVDDFKNISMRLTDEKSLKFVNGVWLVLKKSQTTGNVDDAAELLQENQNLQEKNSMMNAKLDILLDLMAETLTEKDYMK